MSFSIRIIELFNMVITKLKGENFRIDRRIPISYLLSFFLSKGRDYIIGMYKLRTTRRVFVGTGTKIKAVNLIKFGTNLSISKNCYIDALSQEGIEFGDNVSIGKDTDIIVTGSFKSLGNGIKIGNNVGLGTHGHYGGAGGLQIGNDTIFGNYVSVHPENHNYSDSILPIRLQGVTQKGIKIGNNCWIGAKATILDGTIIGNGCIVAAGAVVSGIFPDNVIIGGVPARIIKSRI